MKPKTRPYDSASYLTDDESIVAYIEEVIDTGDPALISHARGVVARARAAGIEERLTDD